MVNVSPIKVNIDLAYRGHDILYVIPIICIIGLAYSYYCYRVVARVIIHGQGKPSDNNKKGVDQELLSEQERSATQNNDDKVFKIYILIRDGAQSFLISQYKYLAVYVVLFSILIVVTISIGIDWEHGLFTAIAFFVGAITSTVAGYIGMKIATFSNARTAIEAKKSLGQGFHVAFAGGSVMGFSLVSLGLLVLFIMFSIFIYGWLPYRLDTERWSVDPDNEINDDKLAGIIQDVMRCLAGFGIGASSVALFARVGGGIYTKAADVGADLVGKVEKGIPEDDPRNPATIADNVGDNVGDIAGMGADLFGSFAGSTCASFVLAAHLSNTLKVESVDTDEAKYELEMAPICFSLYISGCGIIGCLISAVLFTAFFPLHNKEYVKKFLSLHELVSTIISAILVTMVALLSFGADSKYHFTAGLGDKVVMWWSVSICVGLGLFGGWLIGAVTEYFTSTEYKPVQEVAASCKTGAATNIIYGLALGYLSTGIPVIVLSVVICVAMALAGMYGVSLAALGVLTTLCTALTVDAFGPIADNAGGIAEMAELGEDVRERTDILDATGNTTAAIGKGFAIGSAGLVGVALMGAFQFTVSPGAYYPIIDEFAFSGLLIGAMLPYIFSALTMKAVGFAALEMVNEVRDQFRRNPGIMDYTVEPDYDRCISISTQASLKQMILPGLMVIFTPIIFGFAFGTRMIVGILAGSLVSGVQAATSASNTGGAWDNAKKFIEAGRLEDCEGKGTPEHHAAVIGDTVGDPLKDTSGPALNILIKLMGIISIVFAKAWMATHPNEGTDIDEAS